MRLMTKKLERRFAEVGSQENVDDLIIVAKFVNPCGQETWYLTQYDPKRQVFFGFVLVEDDCNVQWSEFSLKELESFKCPLGVPIERDLDWTEQRVSSVIG